MSAAPAISACFRIVGETGVSAGVRRIEAVTGAAAEALMLENERRLLEVAGALRTSPAELPERVAALVEDRRRLERLVADLQTKLATGGGAADAEDVAGVKFAARNLGDVPARDLKGIAEAIGKQIESGVVALVSTADGKASVVVAVSPDLTSRISAVGSRSSGQCGGGRPWRWWPAGSGASRRAGCRSGRRGAWRCTRGAGAVSA